MLRDGTLTYISLFSSAGVGCYGFKQAGFECIATNEIIPRRLAIQRYNNKCRYDSGYICDDITKDSARQAVFAEIDRWGGQGNDQVDVLVATPPCQGMSVANHKKSDNEIVRNSLVVESIKLVKEIEPRFFIFENVAAFMKTGCTAPDGNVKAIGDVIYEELAEKYVIADSVMNFKNYGSNSSRTRTVVIGVERKLSEFISPIELYPRYTAEKTLREVIGDMPALEWGEICKNDFYHAFRTYPEEMRCWIHDLNEGESAFDNEDIRQQPHRVIDGAIVVNQRKNGDKYTRQCWDKTAPCIHTRNDLLASQNTVHPVEDRVFSIRELMEMMTIPYDFRWCDYTLEELNKLPDNDKIKILKKEEVKIRQSIGEAVPTRIFNQIAFNIQEFMAQKHYAGTQIINVIEKEKLMQKTRLVKFITENPLNLGTASLARIAELTNSKRENNSAYYTNKFIINDICKELPEFDKAEINILEPSVGVGNFLPFIFRKYEGARRVNLDVVDIDKDNIKILKLLLDKQYIPDNFHINFIRADFLQYKFTKKYDLVIGNPPFSKLKRKEAEKYLEHNHNKATTNTFEFFLEKAIAISEYVTMITPKALLNTPEFSLTREFLKKKQVRGIIDFGEQGFKGVLVETICIFIKTAGKRSRTKIISLPLKKCIMQEQSYIMDDQFPYWLIYRDHSFDCIAERLDFDKFTVFRDRQVTNSVLESEGSSQRLRVIKSRNISDDGKKIIDLPGYDSYIDRDKASTLNVYKFLNDFSVFLTPNMTYKPRVMRNPGNIIVNGSVAVLIPREAIELTEKQLEYFSSEEYRAFYKIARNYQTRSLNVDAASVYFYGILREG